MGCTGISSPAPQCVNRSWIFCQFRHHTLRLDPPPHAPVAMCPCKAWRDILGSCRVIWLILWVEVGEQWVEWEGPGTLLIGYQPLFWLKQSNTTTKWKCVILGGRGSKITLKKKKSFRGGVSFRAPEMWLGWKHFNFIHTTIHFCRSHSRSKWVTFTLHFSIKPFSRH